MEIAAVFISPTWFDNVQLRLWVKLSMPGFFVLLTEDAIEGNSVLARELRCSGIVSAIVRLPTNLRSQAEQQRARLLRDESMAAVATLIFDFGNMPGGQERFAGKRTTLFMPRE
jgi:hypothetical protein